MEITIVRLSWVVLLMIRCLSVVTGWGEVPKSIICELSGLGGVLFEIRRTHPMKSILVMEAMAGKGKRGYCRHGGLRETEYIVDPERLYSGCHDE